VRWLRRLAAAFKLLTFGRVELGTMPHAPLVEVAWPGDCICGRPLLDQVHGAAGRELGRRLKRTEA
jgi:hypothetical protein